MQFRTITAGRQAADGKLLLLKGATVGLYVQGTNYAMLATGVKNKNGDAQNPVPVDENGQAVIGAPNGIYDVRISYAGGPNIDKPGQYWSDVLTTPAEVVAAGELAAQVRDQALAAKEAVMGASMASGVAYWFDTKADLEAALETLQDGVYGVGADESKDGMRTRYRVADHVATYYFTENAAEAVLLKGGTSVERGIGQLSASQKALLGFTSIDQLLESEITYGENDITEDGRAISVTVGAAGGERVSAGDADFITADEAEDEADVHLITTGGLKLYAQPKGDNTAYVEQFGARAAFNPDAPSWYDHLAEANTAAFQRAREAAREHKIGSIKACGLGYVLNKLIVPEGVDFTGGQINNGDAIGSVKIPSTVLYQPESYTDEPLAQLYDDSYDWDQWGASLRNFTLMRSGSDSEGTLLRTRRGARACLFNIDMIGGGDGLVIDCTQDSHFYNLRRVNGGHAVRMVKENSSAGAPNALHFYNLWIESNVGRALEIIGASETTMANGIEIFGLKLEGRPTLADQLIYIKNAIGIQIYGLAMPGATEATLSDEFAIMRLAGRVSGLTAALMSGNNNYAGAIKSLVALELTNAESAGINVRMHGKVTGAGTVGALVHYGTAGAGHVMPKQSHFDFSGLEVGSGVLAKVAESGSLAYAIGNTLQLQGSLYGVQPHRPHPLSTANGIQMWVSPNGLNAWELRASNSSMVIQAPSGQAMEVGPTGTMLLKEATLDLPAKLGMPARRTKEQLVAKNPNPASFPGAIVLVENATPKQPAYSDGDDWRWVRSGEVVSTSNDPS